MEHHSSGTEVSGGEKRIIRDRWMPFNRTSGAECDKKRRESRHFPEKPSQEMSCNAFGQQMNHSELDHGLGLTGIDFVIEIGRAHV
jgi:hypothetical protein